MSSVTEYNIHSLPSVSKRKQNVEIQGENHGRESTGRKAKERILESAEML
jgi:hypothetical protein